MSREVWMSVSSFADGSDDGLTTEYHAEVGDGMIGVDVGSGTLCMSPEIAEELFDQLREAINDARFARAVEADEDAYLISSAREITVVGAADLLAYQRQMDELRRAEVA